ncbi:MAG: 50S ribosomal protein L9 [Rhodospirillaceae bacterium]|jgi:large subunit ribosomal protein L9|nr:50S ribosomal protein L9 [Rhodospirillaceae bacterium]MBT3926703.1 50S ribosomal protein L9 [Rhodospirillaceae bacterium]MBT4426302.1 50S ribosomal protein L9 [Rhodospirillaceae bacterium]MBT5038719.1 50S ribosomal protein L9 [Rhodospirillaceae bacterium]MBT5675844.1 50S ribosomal protein L9 [Rhodospirillaceae bacterium]
MDIILLERIERLGGLGEIVQVKNGYARNYLLPQKKALRATEENKQRFEHEREALEKLNDERRSGAESDAESVEGRDFVLIRQASDTLQLYGSVTAKDIADAIIASGIDIKRQQVRLDRPIKTLGIFEVRVAVHPEVIVTVRANVARSEEEAKIQAEGGSILPAHEQEALDEQAEAEAAAKAAESVFEAPEKELQSMADSEEAVAEAAAKAEAEATAKAAAEADAKATAKAEADAAENAEETATDADEADNADG